MNKKKRRIGVLSFTKSFFFSSFFLCFFPFCSNKHKMFHFKQVFFQAQHWNETRSLRPKQYLFQHRFPMLNSVCRLLVRCLCGYRFCFVCGEEAHAPVKVCPGKWCFHRNVPWQRLEASRKKNWSNCYARVMYVILSLERCVLQQFPPE